MLFESLCGILGTWTTDIFCKVWGYGNLMRILGFIPARSGSKRLKNKNLKIFLGHPLIYHTLNFSKKIDISEIFVSTDSRTILSYCKKMGVKNNYLRPKKLSGDNSQIKDAILHAINWLAVNQNKKFDAIMLLQPTTPYRDIKEVNKIIKIFIKNNYDSLATVSKIKAKDHPYFIVKISKNNKWKYLLNRNTNSSNTQDYPKNYYIDNGQAYLCKLQFLKKYKKFIVKNKTFLFKSKINIIDIDDLEDFRISEFRIKNNLVY